VKLWRESGNALELALALEGIGWSQFMASDYHGALAAMEDCLESYRKFGSAKLITRGRVAVGQIPWPSATSGAPKHSRVNARGRTHARRTEVRPLLAALPGRLRALARRSAGQCKFTPRVCEQRLPTATR